MLSGALTRICYSQTILLDLKLLLFKITCLSVLPYGCQTCLITKDMGVKLIVFTTSCYRIMLSKISQTMKSCALPETEPVGDDLRSADNDDDECNTEKSCHNSFKLTLLP